MESETQDIAPSSHQQLVAKGLSSQEVEEDNVASKQNGSISNMKSSLIQKKTCGCEDMAGAPAIDTGNVFFHSYVYALGKIDFRFSNKSLEKELAQAMGRSDTLMSLTDRQALHSVISDRRNRYLARQLCWVFTVGGIETYLLKPRDPADFDLLIESVRPTASNSKHADLVIGLRGPVASPDMCNGLAIPVVFFDQVYSFPIDTLVASIPKPEKIENLFADTAATELFEKIMQMTNNSGSADEHRALNYLAVRYDKIYAKTAEMYYKGFSLSAIEVKPSELSGIRKVVDVVFSYSDRKTDFAEKYLVQVDITEEFPFLVNKMTSYLTYGSRVA